MSAASVDSLRLHQKLCGMLGPLGHGVLDATLAIFAVSGVVIATCAALVSLAGPLPGILVLQAAGLFAFGSAGCALASAVFVYAMSGAEKYETAIGRKMSRLCRTTGSALTLAAALGASSYAVLALRADKRPLPPVRTAFANSTASPTRASSPYIRSTDHDRQKPFR